MRIDSYDRFVEGIEDQQLEDSFAQRARTSFTPASTCGSVIVSGLSSGGLSQCVRGRLPHLKWDRNTHQGQEGPISYQGIQQSHRVISSAGNTAKYRGLAIGNSSAIRAIGNIVERVRETLARRGPYLARFFADADSIPLYFAHGLHT